MFGGEGGMRSDERSKKEYKKRTLRMYGAGNRLERGGEGWEEANQVNLLLDTLRGIF